MKLLIAVISHAGDALNGAHRAIRDTWGKDATTLGADLRFFIGFRQPTFRPQSDEVLTELQPPHPCGHDSWSGIEGCCQDRLQYEVDEILRWFLTQECDYIYLCCNDTFTIPSKLISSGFEKYDCSGFFTPPDISIGIKSDRFIYGHNLYSWPDAGVGYFLSKKAAKLILTNKSDHWPFDIHAGQILGPFITNGEITAATIDGFWNGISWHYRIVADTPDEPYHPRSKWQQKMYKKHAAS